MTGSETASGCGNSTLLLWEVSSKDMESRQRSDLNTGTHVGVSSLPYSQNSTSIQPIAVGQGEEEDRAAKTAS